MIGTRAINNGSHGIGLLSAEVNNVAIQNALISSNSQSAANTLDGINVAAGIKGLSIQNTRSGGVFSSTQRTGIRLEAGATDNLVITGNDLRGNTVALTNNATGNDQYVVGNLPIANEYIENPLVVGSAAALPSGTIFAFTAITLKPGFWDVGGFYNFLPGNGSSMTRMVGSLSLSATVLDATPGRYGEIALPAAGVVLNTGAGPAPSLSIGPARMHVTVDTTVYALVMAAYTTGTSTVFGNISARKVG